MEQKNVKPYDSTLVAISVSCSKGLELDLAEAFLDQISTSPSPYPYNALLEACNTMVSNLLKCYSTFKLFIQIALVQLLVTWF